MNEALEFAKAIPSVVRDAYSDGVVNGDLKLIQFS